MPSLPTETDIPEQIVELLQVIVRQALEQLQASEGGLDLRVPEGDALRPVIRCQAAPPSGGAPHAGAEAAAYVVQTGQPLMVPDYFAWPQRAAADSRETDGLALICAPLETRGGVLGALHLQRRGSAPPFLPTDLDLLTTIAQQASLVVQNGQRIARAERCQRQTTLLTEFSQRVLRSRDLEGELQAWIRRLGEIFEADGCLLALWDERRNRPKLQAAYGLFEAAISSGASQAYPGQTLIERVLESGTSQVVEDFSSSSLADGRLAGTLKIRSALAFPLSLRDRWLGAVVVGYGDHRRFPEEEVRRCEQAASQVLLALAIADTYRAERRRSAELEALRSASLSLTSSLELQPVLEAILANTLDLTGADDAHFFHYDGERLTFAAARWADQRSEEPFSQPREDGLTYTVARRGERIVVPDACDHPLYASFPWGGAIVGLPLRIGERVLGVMNVAYESPHDFDENELRVLSLLADQAAVALENAQLYEEAKAEQGRVQLLYDISLALSGTLHEAEILQQAVDLTAANLKGTFCTLHLLPPGGHGLRLVASGGSGPAVDVRDAEGVAFDLGEGVAAWVASHREAVLVPDLQADARWEQVGGVARMMRSAICTPVMAGDEAEGVLGVFHEDPQAFSEEQLELLIAISLQVALALSNARRYQELARRLAELSIIQRVARVVNSRLETGLLLEEVVQQVQEALDCPVVEIFLVDEGDLVQHAVTGVAAQPSLRIPLSQGILGRVARSNQPILVPDIRDDPDYLPGPYRSCSEIAVPLRKGDMVIGVLNLESQEPGRLTEGDLRLMVLIADQVSVAIENAALYERLRRNMAELETTVARRTAELEQALEQARRANRAKTQFVSDVSHELRTPLSNIRLYLDLLVHGRRERFQEYLETLNRETGRLAALIEDLLTVSRLDTGTTAPQTERLDLNALARGLVEDRRRLGAEKQLKLTFLPGVDLPRVEADAHMLSQAVAHLLTNAMNFTEGGGEITVSTARQEAEGTSWVTLSVADTGIGIPEEEQAYIFDRFFRGAASRRIGTPGTGLGLPISREILDRHHGRVTFRSREGEGSVFTLWLPAPDAGA